MSVALIIFAAAAAASSDAGDDAQYARKVMGDFARCTVKYDHELARKFVLMSPADQLPEQEFKRITDWRCLGLLGGRLKMRPFQYRAALAEELIRKESARLSDSEARTLPPLDWSTPIYNGELFNVFSSALAERRDYPAAEMALGRLGECVVRAKPSGALSVLRTKREADELAAMKALSPQIAECAPAGETLTLDRSNLRAAMALSYYRLAMTAPPASGRGTAQ